MIEIQRDLSDPTLTDQYNSPSAGDTLPSAVRTKCVILVFRAFLFWLPTSISMLVVHWTSGHIMAMGAHDLAFEAESSMVESLCTTVEEKRVQNRFQGFGLCTCAVMKIKMCFIPLNKEVCYRHNSSLFICLLIVIQTDESVLFAHRP